MIDTRASMPGEELTTTRPERIRLEFLDGIRGIAALTVVLFHLLSPGTAGEDLPWPLKWTRYGAWAVPVFIVLSGYCLMLPAARDPEGRVPGGWRGFFKRRGRRILPPYYAALLLTCAFIVVSQLNKHRHGAVMDLSVLSPANLSAHLLLVHNLRLDMFLTLDPPMWSVATEWQIYFLFPLLLVVWRRGGSFAALAAAFVLGLAPHYLLPAGRNFDWVRPWYLGLFALGMTAAALGHSRRHAGSLDLNRIPWLWASLGCAVAFAAMLAMRVAPGAGQIYPMSWPPDVMIGLAAACLIMHCAHGHGRAGFGLAHRVFDSRPSRELSRFSYSLYLIHLPAMWPLLSALRALHLPLPAQIAALLLVVLPVAVGVSYLFYLVAERPFVSHRAARDAASARGVPAEAVA